MTLAGVVLVAWWTAAAPAGLSPVVSSHERAGLYGLGLSVSGPMVGVATVVGPHSRPGLGYSLGGAVGLELLPRLSARLFAWTGVVSGGHGSVRYLEEGAPARARPEATWRGVHLGAGISYAFRQVSTRVTPYVGVDGGVAYDGFTYRFTGDLDRVTAATTLNERSGCEDGTCVESDTVANAWGWMAALRVGAEIPLLAWLATEAELAVALAPMTDQPVSSTLTALNVRAAPELMWVVRGTFSVRLGL